MTNQQGAPEALTDFERRHAIRQGYEIAASDGYFEARPQIDSSDRRKAFQAGFERGWDRHAALVEAQQPAAHVQNPAEIEHVAGDVSKNGVKSNMSTQPATQQEAQEPWAWYVTGCSRLLDEDEAKAEARRIGGTARAMPLYTAPQPSPTPQADSQPALPEITADCHPNLIAAELRRLHAENGRLASRLKAYEDLGGAADDVQLLRMGYAAARLEIQSLQARIKTTADEHADELMVAHLDGGMRAEQPTPQPTKAQAGAVPLTDEQICDYIRHADVRGRWGDPFAAGVRWAIRHYERAHGIGIKGGQHGAE